MFHGRILGALAVSLTAILTWSALAAPSFPAKPGEYLVKFRNQKAFTPQLATQLGVVRAVSEDGQLVLVKRSLVETSASAMQTLQANSAVEYVEPNYIYKAIGAPNDPDFGQLWGMSNTGQAIDGDGGKFTGKPGIDIDALKAWTLQTGSKSVIVAVIDTGVNYNEPDLKDNIYNNTAEINGKAGVDDDGNGYVDDFHGIDLVHKTGDPMDVFGHGTHCSGILGAKGNDGYGVVGVNWDVTILPIRFMGDDGSGDLADAVTAIDYAIKMKSNIMTNSWGGGPFTQSLYDAIARARAAGILFVAAAGNDANNNDLTPAYPASYQLDNILSVAAIDPTGAVADFSNFGAKTVDVAAPGVDILSHTMKGLESWSGTSMATPHVTGVAALLLAAEPNLTYAQVKARIVATSRPLASLRGKTIGGLVNAYNALTNTIAPPDAEDPFNWSKTAKSISTAHPNANNFKKSWKVHVTGAKQIALHFAKFSTEEGFDKLTLKDAAGKVVAEISGLHDDSFSPVIDGDSVTLSFESDKTNTDYGFDIAEVAFKN